MDLITREDEQSNEPPVSIISFVGIPAFAADTLGEYPPLAVMVMYWTPFFISTLFCDNSGFDLLEKIMPRAMTSPIVMMIETVLFMADF